MPSIYAVYEFALLIAHACMFTESPPPVHYGSHMFLIFAKEMESDLFVLVVIVLRGCGGVMVIACLFIDL
jgi:hypothetical protein